MLTLENKPTNVKAKEIIELLEPIPEDNFITDFFTDKKGSCCALGHISRKLGDPKDFSADNCNLTGVLKLEYKWFCRNTVKDYLYDKYGLKNKDLSCVNNNFNLPDALYKPTAKQRVMNLLKEMQENGF